MRKSFILHKDTLEIVDEMPDEIVIKLFRVICQYQLHGTLPEMDLATKMAVMPFINQFKRDDEKYKDTCEKNKENAFKRWEKEQSEGIQSDASYNATINLRNLYWL